MAKKKGGLSRGLGAGIDVLIPDNGSDTDSGSGVKEVDINKVEPDKNQPRKTFDEDDLESLADSIKQYGVIDPLLVQDKGDYYEIVGGERRWRASKKAGLKKVPVIVREFTDEEKVLIALIENTQRTDLNPIEEATTYKRLMEEFDLTQDEVADRVSKSRPAVSNTLRLLNLSDEVQQLLAEGTIQSGHARALLGIKDKDKQSEFANIIIDNRLSVREVEREIKRMQEDKSSPSAPKKKEIDPQLLAIYSEIEEKLKESTGTKVSIIPKDEKKGKIEIEYYDADELDRLVEKLQQ